MPSSYKILSIDESGKASYGHKSKTFVLSGVIVQETFRLKLSNKILKLKKKYLKNEDIVFHSRDMARKKGPFSIFQNKTVETSFWSELISILNDSQISFIFLVADKSKARKLGWQPKTILSRSYFRLLELFLVQITKDKSMGKIIAESDPSQDKQLINAHVSHQTQNLIYRQKITSISLVTKSNQDADVQIADALAPIVNIYLSKKTKNRIEQIKIRLIDRKLKDQNNPSYLEQLL